MTTLAINGVERMTDTVAAPAGKNGTPAVREVHHEYTRTLPALLNQLGVSLRTVRRRVAQLMAELGAGTRFQAGMEAVRRGLL